MTTVFDKQPVKKKKGKSEGMTLYKQVSTPSLAPCIAKSVLRISVTIHIRSKK